jgi:hypothetical protein
LSSKVRFAISPEVLHDLHVTFAFPGRVRSMLSAHVDGSLVREIQYCYGDAVYRIPTGTGKSQACEGSMRSEILRTLEMRRALLLFPDGLPWTGIELVRTVGLQPHGTLRARMSEGEDAQPVELDLLDADGVAIASFRNITWSTTTPRGWPASLEFWSGGQRIWSETVQSVSTNARFVESFFLPPDRRAGTTAQPVGGTIRTLEIPPICFARTALPKGTDWNQAQRTWVQLREAAAEHLRHQSLEVEQLATIEVTDSGDPLSIVLRLTTTPEELPEGFTCAVARKGLATAVDALSEVGRTTLLDLRRGLPKGSSAATPYVRFDPKTPGDKESPGRIVLVVPFQPGG